MRQGHLGNAGAIAVALSGMFVSTVVGQGLDPFAGTATTHPVASEPDGSQAQHASIDLLNHQSVEGEGPIIGQVQLDNEDINMAFQMVSDASGWSVFPGAKVQGKVSLYAKDIRAGDLLDRVVKMAGFVYVREGRIINVLTYEDYMLYYGVCKKTLHLEFRDATQVAAVLQPFVTPRGKLVPDLGTSSLVIYEVPTNLPLLEEIVKNIDLPSDRRVIEVVKVVYADVTELAPQLQAIFGEEERDEEDTSAIRPPTAAATQPTVDPASLTLASERQVTIHPVPRTNHLVLRGYREDVDRVMELIEELDVADDYLTRSYQVTNLSAASVFASLRESLVRGRQSGAGRGGVATGVRSGNTASRGPSRIGVTGNEGGIDEDVRIRMSVLEETNSIIVTAPATVHKDVEAFLKICDHPPLQVVGGIRTYKLENADAAEVTRILQDLIDRESYDEKEGKFALGSGQETGLITGPGQLRPPSAAPPSQSGASAQRSTTEPPLIGAARERRAEKPRVTYCKETNSVIIQATVEEQIQFAKLIEQLDRRRDQVLIEVVLILIRGDEDVDVGVELESFQTPGDCAGHLLFTSCGLSVLDPQTGERIPAVLPGGTGAVIRHNEVPIIMHALQNSGKATIRSAPRLLVNDNSEGRIQSVAEEPYGQVNASTTVATTTFGGFVQAGTQLVVTPHISKDEYLRLEYEITLNSFRDETSTDSNLPPARDTTLVASQATVPGGDTLIVGGLNLTDVREDKGRLPLVGEIPVLEYLFGRNTASDNTFRIYMFVTPIILRDASFRDLRSLSDQNRFESSEPSIYPDNVLLELGDG